MALKSTRDFKRVTLTVVLAIALLLPLKTGQVALADGVGLVNPGFEDDMALPHPVQEPWQAVDPIADAAVVVGTEGSPEFPTYADMVDDQGNPTVVEAYKGVSMLRLGTPTQISEKQNDGDNTVYQTFLANSDSLELALRIFSWEHRGYDRVRIDLKPAGLPDDPPVGQIAGVPDDPMLVGTNNPDVLYEVAMDVGKRGNYLDTGWVDTIEITGITPGQWYTLSYTVAGTDNRAHATWAYFDNVNTPPVAMFSFFPGEPNEGDIVELIDRSYDPDPGDSIVSWHWTITWQDPHHPEVQPPIVFESTSQHPYFIPPDEGTYTVSLTVTDTFNASGTVDYATFTDITKDEILVLNTIPKVNALNIEVLPGEEATLIGRFLDPGWLDTHTVTWEVTGLLEPVTLPPDDEDHAPFMGSGITTTTASVPVEAVPETTYEGTLIVDDGEGGITPDTFTVKVVANNPDSREPNDTFPDDGDPALPTLPGNWVYPSWLQSEGDIDIFEVLMPDEQPIPVGAEILVTLKDLPADFDLVLLSQSSVDFQVAGFTQSGFTQSGFTQSGFTQSGFTQSGFTQSGFTQSGFTQSDFLRPPFQQGPLQVAGFTQSGFTQSGFTQSGFTQSGFTQSGFTQSAFDKYPLSQIGFNGLEGDDIGGTDISLEEIGLGDIGTDVRVVGFSANRGLEPEVLLVPGDGTPLYIAVIGANGAYSSAPYYLQIETSQPLDQHQALLDANPEYELDFTEMFTYEPPVDDWSGIDTVSLWPDEPGPTHTEPAGALTLFVTQQERLIGRYGQAEWDLLLAKLRELAQEDNVAGHIISVPISLYDYWDHNQDSIDAANQVAEGIRAIVQAELDAIPSIEYVVFVGNDDIIPYRRVPDETVIGNEQYYIMSSFLKPGSPLFTSVEEGRILTDDYYVDELPIPWQGRSLYIPDIAIARLVEAPDEIMMVAQAFIDSEGVFHPDSLIPTSALVTGYDFFVDGAQEAINILKDAGLNDDDIVKLISDDWTAEILRTNLLGQELHDISSVNAHFTHYAALSAWGFNTSNYSDYLTSEEVWQASYDPQTLSIVFSMGCHAGLNVPDEAATSTQEAGLGVNPALDFAQAMAWQRALYVASTGYGLGDDEGIGGTERLITIFTDKLLQPDFSVGKALVEAKKEYITSLGAMTVYDEKSSIQFTMYGLPQYQLHPSTESAIQLSSSTESTSTTSPNLAITDSAAPAGWYPDTYTLEEVFVTDVGSYFTANGDAQATADRAIQPRIVLPVFDSSAEAVHGVILTYAEFTDLTDHDPVIARVTNEWEFNAEESTTYFPSFWPSKLTTVNSIETGGQLEQTLVIMPGQFRATDTDVDGNVIGTQRLYTELEFQLLRSPRLLDNEGNDISDYEPPVVSSIDLRSGEAPESVDITIEATDDSGIIDKIAILVINEQLGTIISQVFDNPPSNDDQYTVTVTGVGPEDKLVAYLFDAAGNGAIVTGKGANMSTIEIDAGPDQAYAPGTPVYFKAIVSDFTSLANPVSYIWNFGDSSFDGGLLSIGSAGDGSPIPAPGVVIDAEGNATFSVTHTYTAAADEDIVATLKVTDADGGIGVDEVALILIEDPVDSVSVGADIVGGHVTSDTEMVTIGILMEGSVSDAYQYRIKLQTETGDSYHLKYNDGKVTGLPSLQVIPSSQALLFQFDRSDINLGDFGYFLWSSETQAGVQSTPETGIIDNMPDTGFFGYVLYPMP